MKKSSLLLAAALLAASCASSGATAPTVTELPAAPSITPPTTVTIQPPENSPLADLVRPLGSAMYQPPEEQAAPVGLEIPSLRINTAPVIDVGVLDNGEMEIPGASEVGWYRYGPSPGQEGSAVLAAHIAFNGSSGVFRNLDRIELGATVTVTYDDGSTRTFVVTERFQVGKGDLPFDRVFAKSGEPVLTLITCGGDFNRSLRSYDDNVVVVAVPQP